MAYTPVSEWHATTNEISDGMSVNQATTRPPSEDVADNVKWLRDHTPLVYDDTGTACDDTAVIENTKLQISDYTPGLLKGHSKRAFGPETAGSSCTVISNHSRLFVCEEALLYCLPLNTAEGGGGFVVHTDTHTYAETAGSGHMAANHNKLAVMSTDFVNEVIEIIDVSAGDFGSVVTITLAAGTFVGMAMSADRLYLLTDEGATYKLRAYNMSGTLVDDIVLTTDKIPRMCATNGLCVAVLMYDQPNDRMDVYFYDKDAANGLGSRTDITPGECYNLVVSGPWVFILTSEVTGATIFALQMFWGSDGDAVAHAEVGGGTALTYDEMGPASDSFHGGIYPGYMTCDGRFLYLVGETQLTYAAYRLDTVGGGKLTFDHEGQLPSNIVDSTINNIYADGANLFVGLTTDAGEDIPMAYSMMLATSTKFVRAGSAHTTSPTGVWGFLQPIY